MSADYDDLVAARKQCRRCHPELTNPADEALHHFDSEELGPWTRWLGTRPAQLLVVGQDWGTVGCFVEQRGRERHVRTNRRLQECLAQLGFVVGDAGTPAVGSGVFLTNAILCLKGGSSMSGPVKARWFDACAPFLRKTVEVTQTRAVICLGTHAFAATARAFGQSPPPFRLAVDEAQPVRLAPGLNAFAVFHPAARALHRTRQQQLADWQRIGTRHPSVQRAQSPQAPGHQLDRPADRGVSSR